MSEERANSNGGECLAQLDADASGDRDAELNSAALNGYLAIACRSFVETVSRMVAALGDLYRVPSFEFITDLRHEIQSQVCFSSTTAGKSV